MSQIPAKLRQLVQERASFCCEYCLISAFDSFAAFEIDHIIAQKHGGETSLHNLACACPVCNRFKGSDVASYDSETGELVPLFNPRQDSWQEHFVLMANGRIVPQTKIGRVTIKILQLNRSERVKERKALIQFGFL